MPILRRTVFVPIQLTVGMRRIGFLINPIAGMGGRVGLKGTDGKVEEARALGAEPHAPERARRALDALHNAGESVELFTWGDPMGKSVAEEFDIPVHVLGRPDAEETDVTDTEEAVAAMVEADVEVILFVGGDGTAVDITEILDQLGADVPILGVPAGVKIYSSTFAVSPEDAGHVVATFERTEGREVADIDEEAYREGEVRAELRGVVEVPVAEAVQSAKQLASGSVDAVAAGFKAGVDQETTYFLGPGSTVGAIKRELGFEGTPLGVDIWRDGSLLEADVAERELLEHLDDSPTIVVSPIGGQGFIFGRGNQQFSPTVIRSSDVEIVASRAKLDDLGVLRVDTGDPDLDDTLRGWVKVRVGRVERRMMQIV